jgi:nucleoprotein TPR
MHNELEKSGSDARSRLEEQVSRAQRDLQTAKDRLTQETENARQVALRRELEAKEYQERIDKLTGEYHEAREALINAKNSASRSEERADSLARQVAAYEEKLAVYEGRRSQSGGDSNITREQQLETQVADLRGELSRAKMEVEQANKHVEQYKAIAQANEETLAEVNATYDEYKKHIEASIAQKDVGPKLSSRLAGMLSLLAQADIAGLHERVAGLTSDLSAANDENSDIHKQIEAERTRFQQEQQANLDTISNLRQIEAQVTSIRSAAQLDLNEQIKRYSEAHDKYQSELVAHAEDVKALNAVRSQLDEAQKALNEAKATSETVQSNYGSAEASWNKQKESLQKELDEQKKR